MSDEGKKQNEQTKEEKKNAPPIIFGEVTKETNQNGQLKVNLKLRFIWIPIIVAIIGALGIIIAQFLKEPKVIELKVYIKDIDTEKNIPGNIFIDNDNNPTKINAADGTIVSLKEGKYIIRAESEGYHSKVTVIDRVSSPLEISLERIAVISDGPIPLSFAGWSAWNSEITLSRGASANEIIINGATDDAAGFQNNSLPANLQGKTLVLYFSNTEASRFSLNRMVKLVYNRNDTLLRPTNASLLNGEYLPAEDTPLDNGIEFPIPNNFDGKLGFVFYQAELNDLRITAYYK